MVNSEAWLLLERAIGVSQCQLLDLLLDQAKACGATLVIATHDQRIKARVVNHYELTAPKVFS